MLVGWQRSTPAARDGPAGGELVQIDGSPHDWLENRGPRCTLIVFIDDATGALLGLRLAPSESTQAYMETLREVLQQHGRPVALYSDRHSIFRVNHPDHEGEVTQFTIEDFSSFAQKGTFVNWVDISCKSY